MRTGYERAVKILRVDASGRREGSVSRMLTDELIDALQARHGNIDVITRDLALEPIPFVDGAWMEPKNTFEDVQAIRHRDALEFSDTLVAELKAADVVVIGSPIYNFTIPASLKAWIDLVARPRVTFRYTPKGPIGLLEGKRAYVVMPSGGTSLGSAQDFASAYLRHVLGFVGITDVQLIAADGLAGNAEAALSRAREHIASVSEGLRSERSLASQV